MGLLERFNYPSLAALYEESGEILQLLEYESYGYKRDEKERLEEEQIKVENMEAEAMRANG